MKRIVLVTLIALGASAGSASGLSASDRITFKGLGPVKIGMTVSQVERAAKREVKVTYPLDRSCGSARIGKKTYGLFKYRRLTRIYVDEPRYATRAGVRVNDSEQRVMAVYGSRVIRTPHVYVPGGSYLKLVSGNRKIVFETNGTRVTSISTGRKPEIDYVEGCA